MMDDSIVPNRIALNNEQRSVLDRLLNLRASKVIAFLTALFICAFLLFIPVLRQDGHLISGDGAFYYSYIRSLLLDGDFRIENDIQLYNSRMDVGNPGRLPMDRAYAFSVGPGLLWSPFFVAGRGIVLLSHSVGFNVALDGFSYIEESFVCLGSILYALLGLLFIHRTLTTFFDAQNSLFCTLFVFLASSALNYVLVETWMSHNVELFSVGLLTFLLTTVWRKEKSKPFLWGLAFGLVFIVRWQNIVFAPLVIYAFVRSQQMNEHRWVEAITNAGKLLCGFLIAVPVQLFFWKRTIGEWILIPQGSGFLNFSDVHIIEVLFSTRHGLFTWTPIALFGVAGLILSRRGKGLALVLLSVFACGIVVSSAVEDWWAGEAFGMRRLIGMLPIFAYGCALLYERAGLGRFLPAFRMSVLVLVVWNLAFVTQYALKLIPRDGYLNFHQIVTQKVLLPYKLVHYLTR